MLAVLWLAGLVLLIPARAEHCSETVNLCIQSLECQVFSTLTEAVKAALTHQYAEIAFPRKSLCEWTLDPITLPPHTDLLISNLTVIIQGKVLIQMNATLELQDTDLRTGADGGVRVEGTLRLFKVHAAGAARSTIVASGGVVDILSSSFIENFAVFIITSEGEIIARYSTFANNTNLLQGRVALKTSHFSLYFSECVFEGNRGGSLIRLARSTLGPPASISILGCSFRFNSALLFDISVKGIVIAIQSSTFSHNSAGGVRLTDSTASVLVNATQWTYNDNPLLWILGNFSGSVLVDNSGMSFQATTASIYIKNDGTPLDCALSVSNVEMSHFYIDSQFGKAGAIYSEYCTLSISNSAIYNCTNNASELANGIGLMFIAVGTFAMSNVSITDSGGSGMLIAIMFCSGTIDALTIANAAVGSDGVVIAVASSIHISNIAFEGGTVFWHQATAINRVSLLYAEMSTLSIDTLTARSVDKYLGGTILGGYASVITCKSLRIFNATANVAISQATSDILIAHIDCDLCHFLCFATSAGRCTANYFNLNFTRSSFSNALFCFGSGGTISLSNFSITGSQGGGLMSTYSSVIRIVDLFMRDCQFTLLLKDMVLSQASLTSVDAKNVKGALLSASSSTFEFSDCRFSELRSRDDFVTLSTSSLTVRNSIFTAVSSRMLISALKTSVLKLYGCVFSVLSTSKSVMIEAVDSYFESSGTSYFDFNATLIGSLRSPVTLAYSTIANGGFAHINGSLNDFGGALNCIDCPSIDISKMKIMNISADLGGALYIASVEIASTLTIASSEFSGCRANSGAVAVLRNVSFHIIDSVFLNSSAEAAGGALDISIHPGHLRTIERCSFVGNSATEGGAVKWRSAQPHFLAAQFANNSAVYGPDIASYGALIAIRSTESIIAPGQRSSMSFVLLDHYGAQVTTASHKLLMLSGVGDVSIKGINHKVSQAGVFNFTEIEFFAPPDSNQSVLALYKDVSVDNSVAIEYLHTITFRSCEIGEITRNTSCEVCAQGYYSLRLDAPNCSLCPSGATCPGGNTIILKPNHWLTSDPDNPVVSCLVEGRCDGMEENNCTEGYAGLLCGRCREGWFPLVLATCAQCKHAGFTWAELFFAVAIRAVIITAFITLTSKPPDAGQLHALKVLITHIQMISLLCYVQMRIPVELAIFLHLMLSTVSMFTANFPFRCFDRSYYYNAGIASLETPTTLIIILLYFLYNALTHRPSALTKRNIATVLILWSYMQSAVALMAVLPVFFCIGVSANAEWLIVELAQQCWTANHFHFIAYVAAPSLAFNVVLPVLLFLLMFRHQSLLSEYECPCWSLLLQCIRFMCIFSVTAQASNSQSSQLFVGLLFLYLDSVLNSVIVKYRNPKSLCLMQFSGFILIASYSLFLYLPEDFSLRIVASVCFMLINVGFIATAMWITVKGYKQSQSQENPQIVREQQSLNSLIPPNNSVVSEKGIQIILAEEKSPG